MKRLLSTSLFETHRLTTVWLERIRAAGFDGVEIVCARRHLDYRNKAQVAELGHWFRDSTLRLHGLHAPVFSDESRGRQGGHSLIDLTEPMKSRRLVAVDELKRAIEVAEDVPFRYLIAHFGVPDQEFEEARWDAGFSSFEELKVFAGQRGVEVLLENTRNAFSHAERLNQFLAQTHLNLGYCFDIGHAHLSRGVNYEFDLMRERIRSVHLHDNDGREDRHFFPGEGTIDWTRTMNLLLSLGEQLPVVLEAVDAPQLAHPIDEARRRFSQLEDLVTTYDSH